ncbi:hypothetical protein KC19_12G002800 [Ceratodon purpureus]|uniref:Uncharacterized protein n=1 Tax=Ceratodon purpureus TaxID=3225 RepID=A0A8T0G339_CERPU|nr:hypothetical protein KC19_12G002800 [Ceratodon purpureus]
MEENPGYNPPAKDWAAERTEDHLIPCDPPGSAIYLRRSFESLPYPEHVRDQGHTLFSFTPCFPAQKFFKFFFSMTFRLVSAELELADNFSVGFLQGTGNP